MTNVIIDKMFNSKKYKKEYEKLFLHSHMAQLSTIKNINFLKLEPLDLNFLLEVANIFATSNDDNKLENALRIAQFTIENGELSQKEIACMILDTLVNKQAISLAQKNELISEDIKYKYHWRFSLDSLSRELEYSFKATESEPDIECNKFQKEFLDVVESAENLNKLTSVSAPTSAGKSFIVRKWIKYHLELNNNDEINTAIIVPTRALINQFEQDLKEEFKEFKNLVNIISMPFKKLEFNKKPKNIYVFTQERMNIFLAKHPRATFKVVFVDEAHKIAEGERGVLLQSVIDEIVFRENNTKVVFACPFVENPEEVYISSTPLKSRISTVNQNFYHLNQVYRKITEWEVSVKENGNKIKIANINIEKPIANINSTPQALGGMTFVLGHNDYGNLVYANGAATAENIANYIYEQEEQEQNFEGKDEIDKLIELCKETVHRDFILIKFLRKRIAFHYGSMPQQIRLKIEELFNSKAIKYLVCTSTLLEGVNLSCKNIFVRAPEKGNHIKMSDSDLFNLVGRAGRLGKEFFGNIFYINWAEAPEEKSEKTIKRTTTKVLEENFDLVLESFSDDLQNIEITTNINIEDIEATVGYLYNNYISKNDDISNCPEVELNCTSEQITRLNQVLEIYNEKIILPKEILRKHPTTYHYSMQKLLERFDEKYKENPDNIEEIIPNLSLNDNAMYTSLISILSRMKKYFNTGLYSEKYSALITTSWMRFQNIPTIIHHRITYRNDNNIPEPFNTSVRTVFQDIDDIARYKVPKLLSCYVDVMNFFFTQISRKDLIDKDTDVSMYLEYGVNKKTHASMIVLGLSRSTIIKLAELENDKNEKILNENLFEEEALNWLKENIKKITEEKKLPSILIDEIDKVIEAYTI